MKVVHYNEYLVSIMDVNNLVFKQQDISSHSAEFTAMYIQLFMG